MDQIQAIQNKLDEFKVRQKERLSANPELARLTPDAVESGLARVKPSIDFFRNLFIGVQTLKGLMNTDIALVESLMALDPEKIWPDFEKLVKELVPVIREWMTEPYDYQVMSRGARAWFEQQDAKTQAESVGSYVRGAEDYMKEKSEEPLPTLRHVVPQAVMRHIRTTMNMNYGRDFWNPFTKIYSADMKCNCLCGTMLALLACRAFGVDDVLCMYLLTSSDVAIPGQADDGKKVAHALLITKDKTETFETTLCGAKWVPAKEKLDSDSYGYPVLIADTRLTVMAWTIGALLTSANYTYYSDYRRKQVLVLIHLLRITRSLLFEAKDDYVGCIDTFARILYFYKRTIHEDQDESTSRDLTDLITSFVTRLDSNKLSGYSWMFDYLYTDPTLWSPAGRPSWVCALYSELLTLADEDEALFQSVKPKEAAAARKRIQDMDGLTKDGCCDDNENCRLTRNLPTTMTLESLTAPPWTTKDTERQQRQQPAAAKRKWEDESDSDDGYDTEPNTLFDTDYDHEPSNDADTGSNDVKRARYSVGLSDIADKAAQIRELMRVK